MIKIIKEVVSKEIPCYFAVSMGVDSVAAYHWMIVKGYNVTPIHFNHKLRSQNDLMESKYRLLCESTNKNPIVGYGENLVTEKDCRNARLDFYKQVVEYGANILTAHHLNDVVESYLLNCFRGKPNHDSFSLISTFPEYNIVHPFLISRKHDFLQYAERNNLMNMVVTDDTNSIIKGSRRNWIRNNIIPEMKSQKLSLEKYCLGKVEKAKEAMAIKNI